MVDLGTDGAADLPEDGAERPSGAVEATRTGGRATASALALADVAAVGSAGAIAEIPAPIVADGGGDGCRSGGDGGGGGGRGSGGGSGDGVGSAVDVVDMRGVKMSLKRSCRRVIVELLSIS